jgi:hypothetical protein
MPWQNNPFWPYLGAPQGPGAFAGPVPSPIPLYQVPSATPFTMLQSYMDSLQGSPSGRNPPIPPSPYNPNPPDADVGPQSGDGSQWSVFANQPTGSWLKNLSSDDLPLPGEGRGISLPGGITPVAKKSPVQPCVNCTAKHGGLYGPYCPSCYAKSLVPNSDVPPLPKFILDQLDVLKP